MSSKPTVTPRRQRVEFHYKVDHVLSDEDRTLYLAFIYRPTTTTDTAFVWLTDRGYGVSRSAVARHRRRVLEKREERENSLDVARTINEELGGDGSPAFADAGLTRIHQIIFEHLMAIDSGKVSFAELRKYVNVMARSVKAYLDIEKLRTAREDRAAEAKTKPEGEEKEDETRSSPEEGLETRIAKILNL